MRDVSLFIVLISLPMLIALGHDAYLFYEAYGIDNIIGDFEQIARDKGAFSVFASLGFIWTHYEPASYQWAVENFDKSVWIEINTVLRLKAFFVTAAIAGFFYAILLFLRIFGLWPFNAVKIDSMTGSSRVDEMISGKSSGKRMKYKRK